MESNLKKCKGDKIILKQGKIDLFEVNIDLN